MMAPPRCFSAPPASSDAHRSRFSSQFTATSTHAPYYPDSASARSCASSSFSPSLISRCSSSPSSLASSPVSSTFSEARSLSSDEDFDHDSTSAYKDAAESVPFLRTRDIAIPLHLPRPSRVQRSHLDGLHFDEDLRQVPVPYMLDHMKQKGKALLGTVARTSIHCSASHHMTASGVLGGLPAVMRASVAASPSSCFDQAEMTPPDCILAIKQGSDPFHASASASESSHKFLPVHGLTMALNAAALGNLSRKIKLPQHIIDRYRAAHEEYCTRHQHGTDSENLSLDLPVIELQIPSVEAFSTLVPFFYTQDASALLRSLLPPLPIEYTQTTQQQSSTSSQQDELTLQWTKEQRGTPRELSFALSKCETETLINQAAKMHGIWQTAVALGATRDELWNVLQFAWAILVGALAIKDAEMQ